MTEEHDFPRDLSVVPDLSDLPDQQSLHWIGNLMFSKSGPSDVRARNLVTLYVRLVDYTVLCYQSAREAINDYITQRSTEGMAFGPWLRASSLFQSCVESLDLAVNTIEKIRTYKAAPKVSRRLLTKKEKNAISDIRNATQHMYEKILEGKMSKESPIILRPGRSELTAAGHRVGYSELAGWIRKLASEAEELIQYRDAEDN